MSAAEDILARSPDPVVPIESARPPAPPPAGNPVSLRFPLATAAVLLVALGALAALLDFGRTDALVVDTDLDLPGADDLDGPEAARFIRHSNRFEVTRAGTLDVVLERGAALGGVAVACALRDESTGEIRELLLESVLPGGSARATARIDRVTPGWYSLRFDPHYAPPSDGGGSRPPRAHVRVLSGGRSFAMLAIAAGLVLAPLAWSVGRWAWYERRRKTPQGGSR